MVKSKLPPRPNLLLLLLHKLVMVKSKLPLPQKMASSLKLVMVKSKQLLLLPPLALLPKLLTVNDDALSMQLKGAVLTDRHGRIGSIVANRQFQFDGPPPQAGAIYAGGWSITDDGKLAIGNNTVFYQCLSGTFYNLYDESIGDQCEPVNLDVVDLVSC
ncbi:unnamed protein product [[Candida] boidinii]|nr:unnamed protein product [[Candida] boidinii]